MYYAIYRKLDALLYDGPVLQYEVYQDTSDTCKLLIEGSWYAHTGYGLAFPRNSKYLNLFNKFLMEYKENGKEVVEDSSAIIMCVVSCLNHWIH
jgi:ABC-type amino acid transport substrate-binding protein